MALQRCDQNVKTKQFVLHDLLLLRCNTSFAYQYLLSPFLGQVVPATLTKTITSRNGDHFNSIYLFILFYFSTLKTKQKQPPEVLYRKKKLPGPATLLKKRPWYRRFRVNFAKFLRTRFLQNSSGQLLQRKFRGRKLFLFMTVFLKFP